LERARLLLAEVGQQRSQRVALFAKQLAAELCRVAQQLLTSSLTLESSRLRFGERLLVRATRLLETVG
jgi:hypothetical protein